MSKSKYICGRCGRAASLPDFCCGGPMLQKGSYYCKSCGTSASNAGDCCGQPMQQL